MFNRKSKSTSKRQQKNIHENYVIEALEPRLLMAADLPTALSEQLSNYDSVSECVAVANSFTGASDSALNEDMSRLSQSGRLLTLSELVADASSSLDGTLETQLSGAVAAVKNILTSVSSTDLTALASALDGDSLALSGGWNVTLGAAVSETDVLGLTLDISRTVDGVSLELGDAIGAASLSLDGALKAGFTASLTLDLSTTMDGTTADYTFAAPVTALSSLFRRRSILRHRLLCRSR